MSSFLDTSVLVAAFYGDHVHHEPSLHLLAGLQPDAGCCAAHSLVEVFATLTRMPGRHRISADQAVLFLGSVRERLEVIFLTGDEYASAIERAATLGIVCGTIYDAMLAHCALKAGVETLYTWNIRHYSLFGSEVVSRLRTP